MRLKVGIIIPVRNCLDYTRMAVDSVRTTHPYQIIVVDDHSDAPTKDWLASRSDILAISDPPNSSGLASNWNLGIAIARQADCTHYLVINNDIVLHPAAIDNLVERIDQGDVVMATGYHVGQTGATLEDLPTYALEPDIEPETPDFACFMVTDKTLQTVGWFDENYIGAYYEDIDYHASILACGERAISLSRAPIFHFGSRTLRENPDLAPRIGQAAAQNCAYFIRKWNEHPFVALRDLERFRAEGKRAAEPKRNAALERLEAELTQNLFRYERIGQDTREMTFLPTRFIGQGATAQELYWNLREAEGEGTLDILQYSGLTCRLKQGSDGVWRGKEVENEQDVRLSMATARRLPNRADRSEGGRPLIVDCFPFNNELELLEIRLEELKGVVDWFILVESSETYSGKSKPYYFERAKDRFSQYNICHIKLDGFPRHLASAWEREAYTREAISRGFSALSLSPEDVILFSDVDEIPRADAVRLYAPLAARGEIECCLFDQPLSYYFVNCRVNEAWHGTRMIQAGKITRFSDLRNASGVVLPNAGWHFSYLGGAERIREKISAYSHTENDTPEFTDLAHIRRCLEEGVDLFGRDLAFHFTPIDLSFPHYLMRNQERFASLLYHSPEFPRTGTLYAQALLEPSDIVEHLPYLYRLASTVERVTELGTRAGQSTRAFLYAAPKRLVCYDVARHSTVEDLEKAAQEANVEFTFYEQDVLTIDIDETDLLFIDTLHTETQMQAELERHANKAQRYLVFHDTESFAHQGEAEGQRGIWRAISDFMRRNPQWKLLHHFPNNNGLTVFTR